MSHVRVELRDRIGVVTLDRPDVRNALTPEMLTALGEAPVKLEADGARCLLLGGEGRSFCAGFDLALCNEDPSGETMRTLLRGLSEAALAWRRVAVPTVVCAHGAAIAGGAALLGGFDVVVSHRSAKIGYPVLRIGVSPAVSAPFMRLGVGDGATRARMLDPDLIDGARAQAIGLVHECVGDAESAIARAESIANELAEKPPGAIAATKRLLDDTPPTLQSRAEALGVSTSLTGGAEERARLSAMMNRKP